MEYVVDQGSALDVVWDLPGVVDLPDRSISLDVVKSSVTLTFPDASTLVLKPLKDIVIQREMATMTVSALLRRDDTSDWPVGDITYAAVFLFKDGSDCARELGTIAVSAPSGEPRERPVRPWNLLNPLEMRVEPGEQAARLLVCKGCPSFKKGVCLECGCMMKLKSKLARAHCPLGHWGMSDTPVPNEGLPEFLEIKLKHFGS